MSTRRATVTIQREDREGIESGVLEYEDGDVIIVVGVPDDVITQLRLCSPGSVGRVQSAIVDAIKAYNEIDDASPMG